MAFTDSSFKNCASGDALEFREFASSGRDGVGLNRSGTFISATDGTLTIYWTTYSKNLSTPYSKLKSVTVKGQELNEDGSMVAKQSENELWKLSNNFD